MLNTKHFTLLAGNPQFWDDETTVSVSEGIDLCEVQVNQHNRGRRSAQLGHGYYGWSVRAASNLTTPAVISKAFETREEAITEGIRWANVDPDNREFFSSNGDLTNEDDHI